METKNIIIIGIGHHARRIYIPSLMKFSKKMPVNLVHGFDLVFSKETVDSYLSEKGYTLDVTYFNEFNPQWWMPSKIKKQLNQVVKEKNVTGVIISTDPLTHVVYAKWALDQGLNILMDKPISTSKRAVSDYRQANNIVKDFEVLQRKYLKLQKTKSTIFSINVQRRFEIGYHKVFSLIKEVSDRFNIPVTSIQSSHSDGVWIFPEEIVTQTSHPYSQGYGKCSHSGYHLFDIVWQMYLSGKIDSKFPDKAEVFSSFIKPDGLLTQMNHSDYTRYFGDEYTSKVTHSEKELYKIYKDYGENDAFNIVRLLKGGHNICNISINLLHNGFSRRSWVLPGKDLYKGNGRVKHQFYHIQQGPFQCIQVHNYQLNDKQEKSSSNDYLLGGNNHFDIYVFRNKHMFGKQTKPLQVYSLKDLGNDKTLNVTKLSHEIAKERVILEFLHFMMGDIHISETTSNILSHEIPVKIMSSIYTSHIAQTRGHNPIARFKI